MVVGILQFELLISGAVSLKDKRSVINSVKDRLHREHQASVAEVAAQEMLNLGVLGLAVVGSDGKYIAQVLDRILLKLRQLPDAELGASTRRIIHGHPDEIAEAAGEEPGAIDAELTGEILTRAEQALAELEASRKEESTR